MKHVRLLAALFAALAMPAMAQTTAPAPAPARPVMPMPAHPVAPAPTPPARPATPATTPAPAPAAVPSRTAAAAGPRIDVNSATEQQLDALPGIGPARAKAIVAGRPYADLADLVTKKVLSQSVLDGAKDRIALANINTSSAADLQRTLPGIGDVRSKAIVAGRPYAKPDDLVGKQVLTQALFDKIKDLIAF